MSRVFVSFVGSHDLGSTINGPIEQLLLYSKPTSIYLFLTKDYEKIFEEKKLKDFYSQFSKNEINIIKTGIEDPTNHEEIATKILNNIEEINNFVCEKKYQSFVNLSSGTPAIISVLSLFVMAGQLNRAIGIYAPNPKFNTQIKTDSLNYYKNSFAYKTLKSLINNKDYCAVKDFLKKNKILPKLVQDKEFKNEINFAESRLLGDFESAQTIYNSEKQLKEIEYKKPSNLYERAIEFYISSEISVAKNDIFQATLKLAIIRENLTKFLCQKLLKQKYPNEIIVDYNKNKSGTGYFNIDKLETVAIALKEYIEDFHSKTRSNNNFDFTIEINSYTEDIILEYLIKEQKNKNLDNIQKCFNSLQELKKERNDLAHSLVAPTFQEQWLKNIKKILNAISVEYNYPQIDFDVYKKINDHLLEKLKLAL